jgi:hypothetical protein
MIWVLIILAATWVFCAVISAGWFFAYVQATFSIAPQQSAREDLGMAIVISMLYGALGPVGVLLSWMLTGFAKHGWRLKSK